MPTTQSKEEYGHKTLEEVDAEFILAYKRLDENRRKQKRLISKRGLLSKKHAKSCHEAMRSPNAPAGAKTPEELSAELKVVGEVLQETKKATPALILETLSLSKKLNRSIRETATAFRVDLDKSLGPDY